MKDDAGIEIKELRVDGGATCNNLLMQFQADLLGVSVVRPKVSETTALGAAFLAGLAVGFWRDRSELGRLWQAEQTFTPSMDRGRAAELLSLWSRALERAKGWEQP
jgi:glycerol kinase